MPQNDSSVQLLKTVPYRGPTATPAPRKTHAWQVAPQTRTPLSDFTCVFFMLAINAIAPPAASRAQLSTIGIATSFLGITLFLTELVSLFRAGPRRISLTFLNAAFCYYFYLPIATIIASGYKFNNNFYEPFESGIPPAWHSAALLAITITHATVIATWSLMPLPKRLLTSLVNRKDLPSQAALTTTLLACVSSGWLVFLIGHGLDAGSLVRDLLEMRSSFYKEHFTSNPGILRHLFTFTAFGTCAAGVRMLFSRGTNFLINLMLLAMGSFLLFTSQGSRFVFGFVIFAIGTGLARKATMIREWRITRKRLIVTVVIAVLAVSTQYTVRTRGLTRGTSAREVYGYLLEGALSEDQFTMTTQAIHFVKARGDYYYEPPLMFFPIHFIPREIWETKPTPTAQAEFDLAVSQSSSYNVTSSIVGQYFMYLGYPGCVIAGLLLAFIGRSTQYAFDLIANPQQQTLAVTLLGMHFAFLFYSFRYLHPLYYQWVAFAFVPYLLLTARLPSDQGRRILYARISSTLRM